MKYAVELMQIDDDGNCRVRAWYVDKSIYEKSLRHMSSDVGAPDMESIVPASNVQQMATQATDGSVVLKGNPYV